MCGFTLIINQTGGAAPAEWVAACNQAIAHRGPDSEDFFYEGALGMGHRRLSIHDLSDDGKQPMHYLDRYTIIFNGEVFNFIELRAQLEQEGYQFRSKTDTEVILAAYDFWREDCLRHFNGMWSFVIYDRQLQQLFAARDRYGVKPFYYTLFQGHFCAGSEIKQFTVLPGWESFLNKRKALELVAAEVYENSDETLFHDVFQMRGGYKMTYDLIHHNYNLSKWYSLKHEITPFRGSYDEAVHRFRELFTDAVRLRLRSDVKVGSCLSGGLDSSSIVSVMAELWKKEQVAQPVETVSSCFDIKKFDEQEYIDQVVAATGAVSHKVFPQVKDLFEMLEKVIYIQDEPILSTSIFAQWKVFGEAKKQGLTVMLDGQGADEYLAGYHIFYFAHFKKLINSGRWGDFFSEYRAFWKMHPYGLLDKLRFLFIALYPKWISKHLKMVQVKRKNAWLKFNALTREMRDYGNLIEFSSIKALSIDCVNKSILPMLLHYEDRNSMANGIESRVPFLDHRLVEFTTGLPGDYKIRKGWTKSILRDAMKGIVPDAILERKDKMGFVTPEEVWMQEHQEEFKALLFETADRLPRFVDKATLAANFARDVKKGIKIRSSYWRLISLGIWMKKFDVKVASKPPKR